MAHIAKYLSVTAFFIVVGFAASAFAGSNENVVPTAVGCHENGECFISLATAIVQSTGCAQNSQIRFLSTQPGADYLFRTALSAFLAGKVLVVNPSGACQSGFPRPLYLQVQN